MFIVTLATMAGLVSLVTVLALSHREGVRSERIELETARAEFAEESGLQYAMAQIRSASQISTSADEAWATTPAAGDKQFQVGRDGFRLQILDNCARLNLNTANADALKLSPLNAVQVDSLLDWRESSKNARTQGAKDSYYNLLTQPYNAKLAPLDDVTELLAIRGFVPGDLLKQYPDGRGGQLSLLDLVTIDSVSIDPDPLGTPKMDINSVSADQLVAWGVPSDYANAIVQNQGSYKSMSDVFRIAGMSKQVAKILYDEVNIGGAKPHLGVININTASKPVLDTIPGMTPDITSSILEQQSHGFKSLGDFVDLPGVDIPLLIKAGDQLCVSSRSFLIRVCGESGATSTGIEANVELEDNGKVRLLSRRNVTTWEMNQRWGWAIKPSTQTTLVANP